MPARKINYPQRRFKAAMVEEGLTQEKIAKKLGVTQTTVSGWFADYGHMSVQNFRRLCKILHINPQEIFEMEV